MAITWRSSLSRRAVLGGAVGAAAATAASALAGAGRLLAASPGYFHNISSTAFGLTTIPKGQHSISIGLPDITFSANSYVVLTPRADVGSVRLWYSVDGVVKRITLKTSSPLPGDLAVGWVFLTPAG